MAVLVDSKGEGRSRGLRGPYPSERSERGYPAQAPRAVRGLPSVGIECGRGGVCSCS